MTSPRFAGSRKRFLGALGIQHGTLYNYETGRRSVPPAVLQRMAGALGLPDSQELLRPATTAAEMETVLRKADGSRFDLAVQYRALIDQLATEVDEGKGWHDVVAKRLGISRSMLIKVRQGERGVSLLVVRRAARALRIEVTWFTSSVARGQPYSKWSTVPVARRAVSIPVYDGPAMSFDVYVTEPDAPDDEFWANYTANMGAFFAWALHGTESDDPTARSDSRDAIFGEHPKDGIAALDGLPVSDAIELLAVAVAKIARTPDAELARFDAPNGWGKHDSATAFLHSILRACVNKPAGVVRVSL